MRNQSSFRDLIRGIASFSFAATLLAAPVARCGDSVETVIRGNIEKFTTTTDEQTNGAILDNENETVLQWPVHFQEQFKPLLQPGDRVRATGRWSMENPDSPRFLIKRLTNLQSKQTIENTAFSEAESRASANRRTPGESGTAVNVAASSAAPIPTRVGRTIVVRGSIERFTPGPDGVMVGAVLDSDSELLLRWPGALQEKFLGIMKLGDRVRATGRRVQGPAGDNMILVKTVTNLKSLESADDPGYAEGAARPSQGELAAQGPGETDLVQRVHGLEEQVKELRREIERLRAKN